jgi:hypothetical protein
MRYILVNGGVTFQETSVPAPHRVSCCAATTWLISPRLGAVFRTPARALWYYWP